ncbi:MAG: hypothetical protein HYR67_02130 [Bacteroidetes bacterium]|nr:hypothetical protein [Bacteroidota bacterium]
MKIQINDHRKIFAVQEEFNKFLPHMRIDFLSKSSHLKSSASEKLMDGSKTLGDCRVVHAKGDLTLLHSMTVADLKETLRDVYGLSVVVLRRSGTKWIETEENANFSLDEQDKK